MDFRQPASLTNAGRGLMLTTAFLGWMCAGLLMSITSVVMQPAVVDLLSQGGQLDAESYLSLSNREKKQKQGTASPGSPVLTTAEHLQLKQGNIRVGQWVSWLKCAFLFGAAFGGLFFGAIGDRFGRTKGMGLSILTYSTMAGGFVVLLVSRVYWSRRHVAERRSPRLGSVVESFSFGHFRSDGDVRQYRYLPDVHPDDMVSNRSF